MQRLLLFAAAGSGASGSIDAVLPALTAELSGSGQPTDGSITATLPALKASAVGSGGPVDGSITATLPTLKAAAVGTASADAASGWQVRAVTDTGTAVNLIGGVNVNRVHRGINGDEYAELTIPIDHPDADLVDLFLWEIQLWLDGELYLWGPPGRLDASRTVQSNNLAVRVESLFAYFHDVYVGGARPNHIVSPHEDANSVGSPPASWTAAAGVDEYAIVDNAWEFHQSRKGLQVNNAETQENDAYVYQRFTVPASLDRVPFAASAWMNVSDELGGSPVYEGPPFDERGLVLVHLDSGLSQIGDPAVAEITDNTARNTVIRLQTDELTPEAGDILEVRLYAPDAWVAWRVVSLMDGRAEGFYQKDKTTAVRLLADHAQDVSIGKQNHRIGTDITPVGELITKQWPWWRRDNVGELIENLADTFEFEIQTTATTRTLVAKRRVGVTHSDVLTKADFPAWGLGMDRTNMAMRIIHQGEGDGVARDEWIAENTSALRGNVRESLVFAPVDTRLGPLRDGAEELLDRSKNATSLPRATITGALAKKARGGDTVTVNLDHGWAQFAGQVRALAVDFDGAARTAELHLEPEPT